MRRLIKEIAADLVKQMWTFVGLFSAWLVLTGSAKKVVGISIIIAIVLWIGTFNLRQHEAQALRRRIRAENEARRRLLRRRKSSASGQDGTSSFDEEMNADNTLEEEIAIAAELDQEIATGENALDKER
jgi:hypothetical protein